MHSSYLEFGMCVDVSVESTLRSSTKATLMTDVPGMCLFLMGMKAILVQSLEVTPSTGQNLRRLWLLTGFEMPGLVPQGDDL